MGGKGQCSSLGKKVLESYHMYIKPYLHNHSLANGSFQQATYIATKTIQ